MEAQKVELSELLVSCWKLAYHMLRKVREGHLTRCAVGPPGAPEFCGLEGPEMGIW